MHTAPYFAVLGLLTIFHAARVIKLRWHHKVGLGHGDVPELERMIRVFGNHAEYVPLGLVLLLALEFIQAPVWYLHLTGGALVLGRCLHAMGLSRSRGPSPGRVSGMIFTLASLFLGSIGVLIFTVYHPLPQ